MIHIITFISIYYSFSVFNVFKSGYHKEQREVEWVKINKLNSVPYLCIKILIWMCDWLVLIYKAYDWKSPNPYNIYKTNVYNIGKSWIQIKNPTECTF